MSSTKPFTTTFYFRPNSTNKTISTRLSAKNRKMLSLRGMWLAAVQNDERKDKPVDTLSSLSQFKHIVESEQTEPLYMKLTKKGGKVRRAMHSRKNSSAFFMWAFETTKLKIFGEAPRSFSRLVRPAYHCLRSPLYATCNSVFPR